MDRPDLSPLRAATQCITEMRNERSSWLAHWQDLARMQQPRLGRFLTSERNKDQRNREAIYDRTAMGAHRTMQAGMMSGITSPARPWFRCTVSDVDKRKASNVKAWLHRVTIILREVFAKSNTYRALHQCYGELGLFGTWACIVDPDFDTVIHLHALTAGEYMIASDDRDRVHRLGREYEMTVAQIVQRFGLDACSEGVKALWRQKQYGRWIKVCHLIEPNFDRDPRKPDNRNMSFRSLYWEAGRSEDQRMPFLRHSGYRRFNVLAPRWDAKTGDVYGWSPGMEAQGDVEQLQYEQLQKGKAIAYGIEPPLQVPMGYVDNPTARLPGGLMYVQNVSQQNAVKTAWDVRLDIGALREDIEDVRERIRQAYYADLFLMLANDTRSGTTATEIAERHEEKLQMLGPVLERLHHELLAKLIDIAFDYAQQAGIFPEPPPELEDGDEVSIEFTSVLAQAMRLVQAQSNDRLVSTIGTMAGIWPEARHKLKPFPLIDDYAEVYGVPPEVIRDDDEAQAMADREAQAAAQAAQAEAAPGMAQAAATASDIDLAALQNVMTGLQGYSTPADA